ncbi:MAG: TylF/MycF/NovP-related O-methyltransferase [Candidatus Saccharimonadales bacterium]
MNILEVVKYLVYRTPGVRRLMAPRYGYKINPGQLAELIRMIDETKDKGGTVIEIGVGQGDTSVFLLEHLKTTDPKRELFLFDTFNGFTKDSVDYEINERKKSGGAYRSFKYGNAEIFGDNLKAAGYSNFRIFRGDASLFDWSTIAPISVVLLDVDLYKPTSEILKKIWQYIMPGGGIVLDDCLENTSWDGSLQAYREFINEMNMPFIRVGEKGAALRK